MQLRFPNPRALLTVRRRHPLARGLIACYAPGYNLGAPVGGLGPILTPISGQTVKYGVADRLGPSLLGFNDATANGILQGTVGTPFYSFNFISAYLRGVKFNDTPTNDIPRPFTVGSSTNGIQWWLGSHGGFDWTDFALDWLDSTASRHTTTPALNLSGGNPKLISVLGTIDAVTPLGTLYVNGASVAAAGGGAAGLQSLTPPVVVGIGGDVFAASRQSGMNIQLVFVWNRILSAAEALAVHLDPFAFLMPKDINFSIATPMLANVLFAQACM